MHLRPGYCAGSNNVQNRRSTSSANSKLQRLSTFDPAVLASAADLEQCNAHTSVAPEPQHRDMQQATLTEADPHSRAKRARAQ